MELFEESLIHKIDKNKVTSTKTERLCLCTQKKQYFSYILLLILISFIIITTIGYFFIIKQIKEWLKEKKLLKYQVKNIEKELEIINISKEDGTLCCLSENCSKLIENKRIGSCGVGYIFVLDVNGKMYVHGGSRYLSSKNNKDYRLPIHTIKDLDDSKSTSISDMIRIAKKGGGYVRYKWKKEMPMLAYVIPINGTDLIVGGTIPENKK